MSTTAWILWNAIEALFWMWILRLGGASWLAGTFASGLLVHWLAPRWSESGIKLFAWLALAVNTISFVLGLFVPQARLL